jgi:hypothetical protein
MRIHLTSLAVMVAGLAVAAALSSGCAAAGWACRQGQKSGDVVTLSGRIVPGQVITHIVPYDQQGHQNDIHLSWVPDVPAGDPRIRIYATSLECSTFVPPADPIAPSTPSARRHQEPRTLPPAIIHPKTPCSDLGTALSTRLPSGELSQHTLLVPGGPGQRRPWLREYRLHLVAGGGSAASYTVSISWFRGPDC